MEWYWFFFSQFFVFVVFRARSWRWRGETEERERKTTETGCNDLGRNQRRDIKLGDWTFAVEGWEASVVFAIEESSERGW